MRGFFKKLRFFWIFVLLFLLFFSAASAQQNDIQIFLTWKAENSLTPPFYAGKVLPNSQSPVRLAVSVIDGGVPINLSEYEVRWFLGIKKIASGKGLDKLVFSPDLAARTNKYVFSVEVRGYKNSFLKKSAPVPVSNPIAVISPGFNPNALTGAEATLEFEAQPFFFPAKSLEELSFSWSTSGGDSIEGAGGSGSRLNLSAGLAGESLPQSVNLLIEKISDQSARAFSNLQIF